ncbi:MAG: hypothetical protein L0219_07405 [Phycisphaerales bacterium]|nr:hypothetical protein [Phycisphaerales bacterium]
MKLQQLEKELARLHKRDGIVPRVADTTVITITGTTETEIFNRPIYANTYGNSGLIRLEFELVASNTGVAAQNLELRSYFGGSSGLLTTLVLPNNANGYGIFYSVWMRGTGTNQQRITTETRCARRDEAVMSIYDNAAQDITEDVTIDRNFVVKAKWVAAVAGLSFTKRIADWTGPF